jgi:hypothetical protein
MTGIHPGTQMRNSPEEEWKRSRAVDELKRMKRRQELKGQTFEKT